MGGALEALKKGLSASLLQTGVGNVLRNIIKNSPAVRDSERGMLMSFLESGSGMEGGSDQIIGIVEQMKETMEADLKESEGSEGEAIESKTARSGTVAVETVQAKADLGSTTKAVA